jgi:undecaprenyl diphosphate synthase
MIPTHLGVIPDGNRRWAKEHGLPKLEGHRRGLGVLKKVAVAAFDHGVKYFTIYGFSTENWRRTEEEVGYLMNLFYELLRREYADFETQGIRFRFLGSRDHIPKRLLRLIDEVEARTAALENGTLAICLNYGGEQELADALGAMLADGVQPADVTPDTIAKYLYGPELPPLDLIIRSSGEHRLSGFMLYRSAYAELSFVQKHWPDFTVDDLDVILADYAERQRRFGK